MRLVFWNCGVASPKGRRSAPRAEAAVGVIKDLVRARPAIIALCETDAELVHALIAALDLKSHRYHQRILDDAVKGGSRWDLSVLYDQQQVRLRGDRPIFSRNDGRKLRAGYGLEVDALQKDLSFELFLAHWPGRLMATETESRRCCAEALWKEIEMRIRDDERVVVLGDFNEEPHDDSICKHLRASRDPVVVSWYRTQRLYNPSWWLASPSLGGAWEEFGTMYYKKSGLGTRWHTLDQALTCHQWLDREARWAPQLKALRSAALVIGDKGVFDHAPIELTLVR